MPSTRPATRRRPARAAEPSPRRCRTRARSATKSTARQESAHARATHDEQARVPPRRRARAQRRSCPGALVRDLEPTARTTSTAAAHTREWAGATILRDPPHRLQPRASSSMAGALLSPARVVSSPAPDSGTGRSAAPLRGRPHYRNARGAAVGSRTARSPGRLPADEKGTVPPEARVSPAARGGDGCHRSERGRGRLTPILDSDVATDI